MKKGFTLIEILAVVTIMGLIFILVIPKIGTSLKHKKKDVDTTTNNLIITAAKNYVNDNQDTFDKIDNNIYCLPLTTLTKKDYLDSPVKNVTDDLDITNSKSVKITYNKGFKYEVVDKKECEVVYVYNEEYTDIDGNKYIKVDYIESPGNKFIDTNYMPNSNTKVEMTFKTDNKISNYAFLFGSRSANNSNQFGIFFDSASYDPGKYAARYSIHANYYLGSYSNDKTIISLSKDGYEFNGDKTYVSGVINPVYDMYIFGMNTGDVYGSGSTYKLYSFKIFENGNLVRDYIPVKDKNEIDCLFDKVERICYYLLEEVEYQKKYYYDNYNHKYTSVAYMESTGTQYIDTGYMPDDNSYVEMLFATTSNPGVYRFLFGSRQPGGKNQFGVFYDLDSHYAGRYCSDANYINGDYSNNKSLISLSKSGYTFNGNTTYVAGNVEKKNNIYIFGMNTDNSFGNGSSYRLYSFKIIDNNSLIRDYIPVVDEYQVPCLFDKVESKCYYNQGDGEFLYG